MNLNHQRALTKPAFWDFNWKWIRNRRVKFPMKCTQGLKIKEKKKRCSGQRRVWVISTLKWWEELVNSDKLQTQPHCLILACRQDFLGQTLRRQWRWPWYSLPTIDPVRIWRSTNLWKQGLTGSNVQSSKVTPGCLHGGTLENSPHASFPEMTFPEK